MFCKITVFYFPLNLYGLIRYIQMYIISWWRRGICKTRCSRLLLQGLIYMFDEARILYKSVALTGRRQRERVLMKFNFPSWQGQFKLIKVWILSTTVIYYLLRLLVKEDRSVKYSPLFHHQKSFVDFFYYLENFTLNSRQSVKPLVQTICNYSSIIRSFSLYLVKIS